MAMKYSCRRKAKKQRSRSYSWSRWLELDKLRGNDVARQSQEKYEALLHEIEKLHCNEEQRIEEVQLLMQKLH